MWKIPARRLPSGCLAAAAALLLSACAGLPDLADRSVSGYIDTDSAPRLEAALPSERPSEKQGWFSDGLVGLALFVVGFGKPILRGGVGIEYLPHQRGQRVHAQAARQREALQ